MRSTSKLLLLGVLLCTALALADTLINPASQLNWPKLTGAGAPSLTCQATYTGVTTAAYGQSYVDTTNNNAYFCTTAGWVRANSGGSVNTGTQNQVPYYAANGSTVSGAAHMLTDGAHAALGAGSSINANFVGLYPHINDWAYATGTTIESIIENNTSTSPPTGLVVAQSYAPTATLPSGSGNQSAVFYNEVNMDGQVTADYQGFGAVAITANTSNTTAVDQIQGFNGTGANYGTGSVTHLFGMTGTTYNKQGTVANDAIGVLGQYSIDGGHVNSAFSFYADTPFIHGGTTGLYDGLFVPDPDMANGATVTLVRGVHLQINNGVTGVGSAYSIDSTGTAPARFAGNMQAYAYQETLHTPASSSEVCTAGQFTDDANYHYVCTATNTWKRAALSSF
jgi:hypothetical protein